MIPANAMSVAETEEAWRRWHRQFARMLCRTGQVCEAPAPEFEAATFDERLVQVIWSDQLLRKGELATSSGKTLEVIEPGRWNTSRGPDFLDARIRLAGEVLQGDIEIHIDSADWRRHGHHQDFEYNGVVLHVALRAHDDRPYEEKQNGDRLERLVVEPVLEPDLETIRTTINPADYPYGRPDYVGFCHEEFLRLPPDQLNEFFLLSGRSRVDQKVARFEAQLRTASLDQVLHQALLTAQGFKGSKTLYFLLSKRCPVSELLDLAGDIPEEGRGDFVLSTLLHVAGIFPIREADFLAEADGETREFHDRLERAWRVARPYFSDRILPPTRRWYAGVRPAGFPTRRLAAVSRLVNRLWAPEEPLFRLFLERLPQHHPEGMKPRDLRRFWKELVEPFTVTPAGHYFETHFTLGGKKQRPQALLGEPAARSLVFNVLLPLAVLEGRRKGERALEERAWALLHQFPALEKNSVTRFMARRLFAETDAGRPFASREIHQQALFKIFTDCCAENERTCDHCTFLALGEALHSTPFPNQSAPS